MEVCTLKGDEELNHLYVIERSPSWPDTKIKWSFPRPTCKMRVADKLRSSKSSKEAAFALVTYIVSTILVEEPGGRKPCRESRVR